MSFCYPCTWVWFLIYAVKWHHHYWQLHTGWYSDGIQYGSKKKKMGSHTVWTHRWRKVLLKLVPECLCPEHALRKTFNLGMQGNACWDPVSMWFIVYIVGDRYVSFKSQCQSALPCHGRFMATRWSYDDCPYSQSNSFSILSFSLSLFLRSTLTFSSFLLLFVSPESMHYQSRKSVHSILNSDPLKSCLSKAAIHTTQPAWCNKTLINLIPIIKYSSSYSYFYMQTSGLHVTMVCAGTT